jgi:amino acid transporter
MSTEYDSQADIDNTAKADSPEPAVKKPRQSLVIRRQGGPENSVGLHPEATTATLTSPALDNPNQAGSYSNGSSTNYKRADEVALAEGINERMLKTGLRPGDRYIRFSRPAVVESQLRENDSYFKIEAAPPSQGIGRLFYRTKRLLIGKPIPSALSIHERLTKLKALAIYSSDALSSVAYATEQILLVLILAGSAALDVSIPITVAIALLLVIVGTSYRQTIFAYPKGGGSYIVAKDNLGTTFGLVAATSLMIGYVLTVSVSVSAGGAAIISALPALQPYLVPMCVGFVFLLTLGNLRGIRESGAIFSAPTYLFIGTILLIIGLGLLDNFFGIRFFSEVTRSDYSVENVQEKLSLFLVLRAFAQGCAALTGVEAISDGVPAFKSPESKNAATTLATLITLLTVMFLGTSVLANHYGIQALHSNEANYESVTSQIAHHVVGNSPIYVIFQAATCLILILGANTAFADFPRLSWFLARDKFLPHLFSHQGDRLAFSTGIIVLAILSASLIIFFSANVEALVPLYAIGVFTSFTLSQSGMVKRWLRLRSPGWHHSLALNLMGALTTFTVLIILTVTQLLNGAWVVIVLVPIFYMGFRTIHRYYQKVTVEISLEEGQAEPLDMRHHAVIVPINDLNQVTRRTLSYANTLSDDVTAVHINDNLEEIANLRQKWEASHLTIPLVIVETPYRSVIGPLLSYVDIIHKHRPREIVTVVVPEFVASKWWQQLLHNQTALRIKAALLSRPGIVVTSVPYHHKN